MDIHQFFKLAVDKRASDLHLVAGYPPTLRIHGELVPIADAGVLENKELTAAIFQTLSEEQRTRFTADWELDYAYQHNENRFRVNLHYQLGAIGLAARLIPGKIPTPEAIHLEPSLYDLTHLTQGFVLVTGPTGCGKSTTLATMINIINQERPCRIVTLEDPIEFIYPKLKGVVAQREVGRDTRTFNAALRHILRQDPDVILIGEMRDTETIAAALTAAETGHLVFSTLHTNSAAETVERIIDSFDTERQRQILIQFAAALRGVVTQQLVPTADGHVTVAREIMLNTPAVANLIRQNKIAQIQSVIQTSKSEGMVTMNNSLRALFQQGIISEDVYNHRIISSDKVGSYF